MNNLPDYLDQHTLTATVFVFGAALVAFAVNYLLGLEKPWLQWWALLRALVQLGILSFILHFVVADIFWVCLFLVLMVAAAAYLVVKRLNWGFTRWVQAAVILVIASFVPAGIAFWIGAMSWQPNYLLAVGGSVVGNVMSISTLFARTFAKQVVEACDQVEGWLALGATPRRAVLQQAREAGSLALMPTTDQTRVTGIVTLPGAFVGAVVGGLTVLDAATFQLVVLSNALAGGAIAIALWTVVLGAPKQIAGQAT